MNRNIIIPVILLLTANIVFCAGQYTPKLGDDVILVTHKFKKGKLKDAREYFTGTFLNNLKDDNIIRDTLFLENENEDELVIITFASPTKADLNFSDDFYNHEIKSKIIALTSTFSFQLMSVNDEKYNPKVGDSIIIWEYNVKMKNMDDAALHFKNKVYPLLAKDEYSRDSYLLAFRTIGILVGITMFTGQSEETRQVKEKLKELNIFLEKPAKSKTYKLIALNDE
jgi:hypothetical protein